METLFMVYLGGSAPKANIELHDVQFVTGTTIEDTYDRLRDNWFGDQSNLHLDSYKAIHGADGHSITISNTPQDSDLQLYFVNLGGYQSDRMNEIHDFGLFVARNAEEAKLKAKTRMLKEVAQPHKDNLLEVDDCLKIDHLNGHYIHLTPTDKHYDLKPDWFGYRVIGR